MSPLPTGTELLKHVTIRACTSPVSLFFGTAGVLLLSQPATLPIAGVAFALQGLWVWSRIRSPSFARAGSEEMMAAHWRGLLNQLEGLVGLLDRDTATVLAAIVEAQERLLAMSSKDRGLLPHSRVELTSLLRHCLSLAERRRHLHQFLGTVQSAEVQRQARSLETQLDRTNDPITRKLYEQALDQKRQELENYVHLEAAVQRIDGQLLAVRCTFDNILSRMVALQSADQVARSAEEDPVYTELNQLTRGIAALEASLDDAVELRGTA
jgi:chorismate mutase